MTSIESRLLALEDEQDILRTLYAYGHSIDYGLEADWINCWTEDAVLQWPNRPPLKGHDALRTAFRNHTHAPQAFHKHVIVEPRIDISGDRATVQTMFARLDRYPSGPAVRSFGRDLDVLVRCKDGPWRFLERICPREASRAPRFARYFLPGARHRPAPRRPPAAVPRDDDGAHDRQGLARGHSQGVCAV